MPNSGHEQGLLTGCKVDSAYYGARISELATDSVQSTFCKKASHVFMKNVRQISIFTISALFFVSLVAFAETPNPGTDCKDPRFDTSALYDWPTKQNIFYVKSTGGLIGKGAFLTLSAISGSSVPAKELASWLDFSKECPLQLTVAGKSESMTLRVIKDAFSKIGKGDLHRLDLTFVGSAEAASTVEKLVVAVGGSFHTRAKLDD